MSELYFGVLPVVCRFFQDPKKFRFAAIVCIGVVLEDVLYDLWYVARIREKSFRGDTADVFQDAISIKDNNGVKRDIRIGS